MTGSLPSWERGLKRSVGERRGQRRSSLPSWERGLKQVTILALIVRVTVAPLVGAWIETDIRLLTR